MEMELKQSKFNLEVETFLLQMEMQVKQSKFVTLFQIKLKNVTSKDFLTPRIILKFEVAFTIYLHSTALAIIPR